MALNATGEFGDGFQHLLSPFFERGLLFPVTLQAACSGTHDIKQHKRRNAIDNAIRRIGRAKIENHEIVPSTEVLP